MRYRLAIVMLSLVTADAASAAPHIDDTAGLGLSTCAVFGKEYSRNPEYVDEMWFSWLQGYLSGLNAALRMNGQQRHDLAGMKPDEKKEYLRRFCNEHPLDTYITGAKKLFISLPVVDADRAKPAVTLRQGQR
jgi:hypothetical protein